MPQIQEQEAIVKVARLNLLIRIRPGDAKGRWDYTFDWTIRGGKETVSVGEIVGLCATVALLAGMVGASVGVLLARSRDGARSDLRDRRIAAGQWIAAIKNLHRAALSFVAAFRALADEPPDSPNRSLREQEAQRCRGYWFEACRDLDQAEARCWVHDSHFPSDQQVTKSPAADVKSLREVIDGDASRYREFAAQLRSEEATALKLVEVAMSRRGTNQSPLSRLVSAAVGAMDAMIERWGRQR